MPRIKKTDPSVRVEAKVPKSVMDQVQRLLFSEVEGRVPYGATSELVTKLLRSWLAAHASSNLGEP